MNARFLIWNARGEAIKVTLHPGEVVSWSTGGPDDEGWHSEGEILEYADGGISRTAWTDGRDCDGRLSTETRLFCPMERLHSREYEGLLLPDWERIESSQRDYQAEAAGY